MNRRGFLGSLLGLATTAALPIQAIAFIEKSASLPDVEFVKAPYSDEALIALITQRMQAATEAMMRNICANIYDNRSGVGQKFGLESIL